MKSKKRNKLAAGFIVLVMMLTGVSIAAYCWSAEGESLQVTPLHCQEYIADAWNTKDSLAELNKNEEGRNGTLLHNNGKPFSTDIFSDGQSQGNYLVAVYHTQENGVESEHYYFTNEPDDDREGLVMRISESELSWRKSVDSIADSVKAGGEVKTYTWYHKKNAVLLAVLRTTVIVKRESSDTTIDGTKGSIWNVRAFTQLERVNAARINGYRTGLSVDQTNQKLLSYGPIGDKSGGTVGVSLTGLGASSVSDSFRISGFSVSDLSSISKKYGRWDFRDNFGSLKTIATEPGIRASNTSGAFVTELNHVSFLNTSSVVDDAYQTGIIRIWTPDR